MQYGTFRRQGFFIGSGVIEAGCKTVIGSRCKQSGMFWGEPGAENVLALRCIQSSRRLGEFWKERLNTHAARNDSLALAAWPLTEESRRAPERTCHYPHLLVLVLVSLIWF